MVIILEFNVRGIIVTFRTMRALKLVGKWEALTETLNFLWRAGLDIFYFSVLLGLFIFLFAIIGMELFAHEVKLDRNDDIDLVNGESMRVNFDSIGYALLSAFTLQIGDNWTTYYYEYTRFNNAAFVFFPFAIFVLNIVIMNLFVAIMLEKFFADDQKKAILEEEKRNQAFNERQKKLNELMLERGRYKNRVKTLLTALKAYNTILSLGRLCKGKKQRQESSELKGSSLNLFPEDSAFRLHVSRIVKHKAFQVVSYLCIALNSVVLTFYTPLYDPHGTTVKVAEIIDLLTTIFFCFEILGKVITFGLLNNGPDSFLRNLFNILDLLATLITIVSAYYEVDIISVAKLLHLVRVLRVLRLMTMNEGFRLRIQAIVNGFPKIMQTLFIAMLFIVTFGVIGVHLFKERFYYCMEENSVEGDEVITAYDCMNLGREWRKRDIGFDNILQGCLTLFEMFSGKSWCSMITYTPDANEYDHEPQRGVSLYNLWFPVTYMFFGFLFIRSLLTGVISNTFYYHNEELQGLRELTSAQRRWVSLTKIIFKVSPGKDYKPDCRFYTLYRFLIHPLFYYFILLTIILNGIILCLAWYRAPSALLGFCEVSQYIFLSIYSLEAALKLLFYGRDFFDDNWNIFDLVVVILLLIITSIAYTMDSPGKTISILLTVCRVSKLCSLFHKIKVLRDVFQIFVLALPSVINLALLLFVVMYIFAVIGIFLFAGTKLQDYLNHHANFQNLGTAFLTIFRMSTYDGWIDIMHDAMRGQTQYFNCIPYPSYTDTLMSDEAAIGCGVSYAPLYFVVFILVVPFLFLNIFVAIVMTSVIEIARLSESVLSDERLNGFLEVWKKYDPRGKGYIQYYRLWNLLYEIPEPLGAAEKEMNNRYYCAITLWMLQLRIYRHQGTGLHYVAFYDVLEGLVKRSIYRPQTLDKIYNNLSRDTLIKGLEELWDQRTQLAMESEMYVKRIEDLKYYYESKMRREEKSRYKPIKVNLPLLVWIILKISKHLRRRVKARKLAELKKKGIEKDDLAPPIIVKVPQKSAQASRSQLQEEAKSPIPSERPEASSAVNTLLPKTITKEADSLTISHFGGLRFEHNVPKPSEKIKSKSRFKPKPPKHNVPIDSHPKKTKLDVQNHGTVSSDSSSNLRLKASPGKTPKRHSNEKKV